MKKMILMAMVAVVGLLGCASTNKSAMWQGDWNPEKVKWVAETRIDGDVPRTVVEKKPFGSWIIF